MTDRHKPDTDSFDIAVVGMAGRFPGADDLDEFWRNLQGGVESITRFTDEELLAAGVAAHTLAQPNYVKAKGILKDVENFAAEFFGFTAREARHIDPQHRIFLECVWQALENAGYDPRRLPGPTGLYAGAGTGGYMYSNLLNRSDVWDHDDGFEFIIGNDKDYIATRTAYKLNLNGPCFTVQSACSTSLVAIHQACQSLLNYECDMALAGGSSSNMPLKHGYHYQEGMVFSPDGHCRSFDAKAGGTVFGSGVGVVALRRLDDALADGDCIRAVIKGSAVVNDGSAKIGFTAPGVEGQAKVIAAALGVAGIDPETIQLVEAHGTATPLGDPIEIEALTRVYRAGTKRTGFCAVSSVKSNVGHLEVAAGVAGFIKAVLQLEHKQRVPSLHFESPNPRIDFDSTPFYVNTRLDEWPGSAHPRRAAVNSFGIGGTNAHVVLEEAPALRGDPANREQQLLLISAQTPAALNANTERLAAWLKAHPQAELADVAWTLQSGRTPFAHRRSLACRSIADAVAMLESASHPGVFTGSVAADPGGVVFMFPGQGAQYPGMGRELYQSEAVFRDIVDRCAALLQPQIDLDIRAVLFPAEDADAEEAARRLSATAVTQPALFIVEYALARLLQSWGIQPQAMIGHSIGEWVAACLAGVFTLEDALSLVAARGRLMQSLPEGAMLSVGLPEAELKKILPASLCIAAINAPDLCVASGPSEAVAELERSLNESFVSCRRLHTSHAFHSSMMEPILDDFAAMVGRVPRHAPSVRYLSNVTGAWITPEQATDPAYWAQHLRHAVRFSQSVETVLADSRAVLLEVGPGATLSTLALQGATAVPAGHALPTLPRRAGQAPDSEFLMGSLGRLWQVGITADWQSLHGHARRQKLALPGYAFERQRYWVEPRNAGANAAPGLAAAATGHPLLGTKLDMAAGHCFVNQLSATQPWFIDQHRVLGMPVLPGSALVEWILAASRAATPGTSSSCVLENVAFQNGMRLAGRITMATQTLVERQGDTLGLHCFGRNADKPDAAWLEYASASWSPDVPPAPVHVLPSALTAGMAERSVERFYAEFSELGAEYGPAFQAVKQLWRGENTGVARIEVAEAARDGHSYWLHPVVLDACMHCVVGFLDGGAGSLELPAGIDRLVVHGRLGGEVWCRVSSDTGFGQGGESCIDLQLFTPAGECVAELIGLRYKPVAALIADDDEPAVGFYQTEWQLLAAGTPALPQPASAPWLLFCPDQAEGRAWQAEVERLGHRVVLVCADAGFERCGATAFTVDASSEQSLEQLLAVLRVEHPVFGGVMVHGAGGVEQAQPKPASGLGRVVGSLFSKKSAPRSAIEPEQATEMDDLYGLIQAGFLFLKHFLSNYADAQPDMVMLSRCAYEPEWGEQSLGTTGLRSSVLSGMLKALLVEFPGVRCVQVDLDAQTDAGAAGAVLSQVAALRGSGHLALRGNDWLEARLQASDRLPVAGDGTAPVRADASYLITGGWGDLGMAVAQWLAEQGAGSLVLTGRTLPADQAPIAKLRERGVQVTMLAADVADIDAMRKVFDQIGDSLPPLRGIVHAAGIANGALLAQMDWPRYRSVLDPKVRGAWNLHLLSQPHALDFFVLFSSQAAMLGSADQSYTVANSVLDALARYRVRRGLPALSINWGAWAEIGMAVRHASAAHTSGKTGVHGLRTSEATAALARLLAAEGKGVRLEQVGVFRVDWARLVGMHQGRLPYRLLADLAMVEAGAVEPRTFRDLSGLTRMPSQAAQALILDELLDRLALALGLDDEQMAGMRPTFADCRLPELGLDSLMAIQMRQRIREDLGVQIELPSLLGAATAGEIALAIFQQKVMQQLSAPAGEGAPEEMQVEEL